MGLVDWEEFGGDDPLFCRHLNAEQLQVTLSSCRDLSVSLASLGNSEFNTFLDLILTIRQKAMTSGTEADKTKVLLFGLGA